MALPKVRLLILAGILIWCAGFSIPSCIAHWEYPSKSISSQFYSFYSVICHQFDDRSFHIFGHKLAVCARCTGIYAGFFLGSLMSAIRGGEKDRPLLWWSAGLLPMLIDVILEISGIHHSSILLRFLTGSIFGIVAASILFPILTMMFARTGGPSIINQGASHEPKT